MKRTRWSLADVQSRMFNVPLMVAEDRARLALGVMGPRLNIAALITAEEAGGRVPVAELSAQAQRVRASMEAMPGDGDLKKMAWMGDHLVEVAPYEIWNGVAILPVRGTLMAENGLDPASGATGYDGLSFKARHAQADKAVKGAILDIDSGGGEVVDLFETCQQLRALADAKPMRAIIRGQAASAAYALAACAGPGNVTAADYSIVGSIGAIMMHADFSKQLDQDGIDVTMIKSAEHKDDMSWHKALDAEIAERLQAMVVGCAECFIDHVADARAMDRGGIAAQQARFYSGQQVLDLGLVDQFMAYGDSMKEFAATVNGTARRPAAASPGRGGIGVSSMKEKKMDSIESALAAVMQPECAEADARAALTALHAAARAEGQSAGEIAGIASERERITALIDLDSQANVSDPLSAAIAEGTSAGDYAIALAKSAKNAGAAALAAAAADAAPANALPASNGGRGVAKTVTNRGQAYAERKKAQA